MATEPTLRITSRRALLAGSLAAAAAGALARVSPATAATAYVELGNSNSATGETSISNISTDGSAFRGDASGSGYGVYATSVSGEGVHGRSDSGTGVFGASASGAAVVGSSASATGVLGIGGSSTQPAIVGLNGGGNTGLMGYSGTGSAASPAKTGVCGSADQDARSVGLRGSSPTGRGGVLVGKLAQLKLQPSGAPSQPASGQAGDLFVDKNKRLWFCKGGTTWKQIA